MIEIPGHPTRVDDEVTGITAEFPHTDQLKDSRDLVSRRTPKKEGRGL